MALVEAYREPQQRRHLAHVCSAAVLLQLLLAALLVMVPLLVAYRSQGLWIIEDDYREQPEVWFKHQLILQLQLRSRTAGEADRQLVWSTFANYNRLYQDSVRMPVVKSREADDNGDGVNDQLIFELEMPLADSEDVVGVDLLLMFDYKLNKFVELHMESAGLAHHVSGVPGSRLVLNGHLEFHQREALAHSGSRTIYNTPIVNGSSVRAEDYDLANIYAAYLARNETTNFVSHYPAWRANRASGQPFQLQVTLRYPSEVIIYRPGFWQEIKFAWIQYLALAIPFLFILNGLRSFIFTNQLVHTVVRHDSTRAADTGVRKLHKH